MLSDGLSSGSGGDIASSSGGWTVHELSADQLRDDHTGPDGTFSDPSPYAPGSPALRHAHRIGMEICSSDSNDDLKDVVLTRAAVAGRDDAAVGLLAPTARTLPLGPRPAEPAVPAPRCMREKGKPRVQTTERQRRSPKSRRWWVCVGRTKPEHDERAARGGGNWTDSAY